VDEIPYHSTIKGWNIRFRSLIGDPIRWKPPSSKLKRANILVFGWAGSGKSTLINTILSLFAKEYQEVAPTLGLVEHCTLDTQFYDPEKNNTIDQKVQFAFLDTPGLTNETYANSEFGLVLKGLLPEGIKLVGNTDNLDEVATKNKETAMEREIHAVINVLPQGAQVNDQSLECLKSYVASQASIFGITPFLVVTHADEVPKQDLPELKNIFSKKTGVSVSNIAVINNGLEGKGDFTRENFERDRELYHTLTTALQLASHHIVRKYGRN